MSSLTPSELV